MSPQQVEEQMAELQKLYAEGNFKDCGKLYHPDCRVTVLHLGGRRVERTINGDQVVTGQTSGEPELECGTRLIESDEAMAEFLKWFSHDGPSTLEFSPLSFDPDARKSEVYALH